jgi:hypothetical protein
MGSMSARRTRVTLGHCIFHHRIAGCSTGIHGNCRCSRWHCQDSFLHFHNPFPDQPGGRVDAANLTGITDVIGIISLAYQVSTYTTRKNVVDLGPIQVTKKEYHLIPLPPILGALALVGGVIVLAADRQKA